MVSPSQLCWRYHSLPLSQPVDNIDASCFLKIIAIIPTSLNENMLDLNVSFEDSVSLSMCVKDYLDTYCPFSYR